MRASVLLFLVTSACYRSHGPSNDAAVPAVDAGLACELSFTQFDGTHIECTIPASSSEPCAEAALCQCAASGPMTSTELVRCAGWDLTPRGALTFADFCTTEPPPRHTFGDALRGYLMGARDLEISGACDAMPALIGPRPYAVCATLVEQVCACGEPCDLDARLGRACLGLTSEQAHCVSEHLGFNNPCAADVPSVVRACGG